VTQEIFAHAEDWYQADPEEIILIGDSAGASLAFTVSAMARDRGGRMAKRQILIYPSALGDYRGYTGLASWKYSKRTPFESVHTNGTDYLLTVKKLNDYMELYASAEEDYTHPLFAPLNNSDFSCLPQTLLVVMEYDPLRDEGRELGMRMRREGCDVRTVVIRNGVHGMFSLPSTTPVTSQIYESLLNFLPTKKDDSQ
jgi:acetyl esterase/lipase